MPGAFIPVVDFSACALTNSLSFESKEVKKTVDLIAEALENQSSVYLINHGVDTADLQTLRGTARAFFNLPVEEKLKSIRRGESGGNGWVGRGMEVLDSEKMGDLKECYNITLSGVDTFPWPSDHVVPGFRDVNRGFMKKLNVLARRLFTLLGLKYSPQDPQIFSRAFEYLETEKNKATCLRSLYYPPMSQCRDAKPGQFRCCPHTDYGIFTFLLQDMIGGLQVLGPDEEWLDVEPLDGAILLQAGDMIEIWTAGRVKATLHRVRVPTGEKVNLVRECTAYFLQPDDNFLVRCLDGSDKYTPVTSGQYFDSKVYTIQASDEENREKMLMKGNS